MKNRILLAFLLLGHCAHIFSQSKVVVLSIQPFYRDQPILLSDSAFAADGNHDLQIETLRFYISNVQFLKAGEVAFEEADSYHLVDAGQTNSLRIAIANKEGKAFDELRFSLGIDSITNASGAMGGDLDPTKGMYWAWQSGYINFKLEGKSKQCQTRNQEFVFHLGGYQGAFYAMQPLSFSVKGDEVIALRMDIAHLLSHFDLSKQNQIMSPSALAVELSKVAGTCFKVSE